MSIALLGIGLLVAIWLNIKMARQLEEVIRGFNAQQQVVRSSEKLAEDAHQQTSAELAKAEASLGAFDVKFKSLVSQIKKDIEEQKTDRQEFQREMERWSGAREEYNRLLSSLSTKIEKIIESSDLNRSSNQGAGGKQ